MMDYLKKSLLTGICLALKSKKEINDLAYEFTKSTKMSREEAKDFLVECQDTYEDAKKSFDKKIETSMAKILIKLDLPSRSDIQKLNDKINELNKKISNIGN